MSDDNDVYTVAGFREHQDGYQERDPDAAPHAGIVRDPLVSRYLAVQEQHYDPDEADAPGRMPGQARNLTEVQQMRGIAATETAREALENGDMTSLKHLTGQQDQRADISGMKAISKIDQIIESPAPVIVLLGEMGAGKTNMAGLIGQRAKHLLGVEQVASNIKSLSETTEWVDSEGEVRNGYVPNHHTLEQWVEQDGDPLDHPQQAKLFIGDEFSSKAGGTGKMGHLTRQKMGPLVYKIRKYNGLLIYIAHDESSIHPLLWRLGVIIKKTSQKEAVVADRIKNGQLKDTFMEIEGIPPTDWRYHDKEASTWSWTDGEEGEEPDPDEVAYDVALWTVRRCKEDGLTHRQTAKYVPFGKSWVGKRWPEIQDGDHDRAMDRVRSVTA
ncbi:hypothetical protein [Haloarcula sediminis]|uniref:hypothetical protein n=1 Tax=Haloarcula sediminis TaxID=3111777 RepID=UPI002D78CBFE|nr:hypothetical protein [Haloarcula sp. CK38]